MPRNPPAGKPPAPSRILNHTDVSLNPVLPAYFLSPNIVFTLMRPPQTHLELPGWDHKAPLGKAPLTPLLPFPLSRPQAGITKPQAVTKFGTAPHVSFFGSYKI